MDISKCIKKLGLSHNQYLLNKADAPNKLIEWRGPDTQPTDAELEIAWTEILMEEVATKYQLDRKDKYPLIEDQLDMIYHAGLGGDEFQAAIKAVKDAYPKPKL